MATKKKIGIKEIMYKISYIFKNDFYIVNNSTIINGTEPDRDNPGSVIIKIDPEFIPVMDDIFHNEIIHVDGARKFHKAIDSATEGLFYNIVNSEIEKKSVLESIDKLNARLDKINNWDSFIFTPEEKEDLLDSKSIYIFKDRTDIPDIYITKTLFPLITKSDLDGIYYNVTKNKEYEGIYNLVISYDTKFFQVYSYLHFIELPE